MVSRDRDQLWKWYIKKIVDPLKLILAADSAQEYGFTLKDYLTQ